MSSRSIVGFAAVVFLGLCAGSALAHGDEDHSQDQKSTTTGAATVASAGAVAAETTAAQRLPDGSLFVPKAVQRQLGLRTAVAAIEDLASAVVLNGKVIADANAGGRVQASQSGRIEPGPKGLPTLGQRVTKGQVLAYLRPSANSIERGNQQAQLADLESQFSIAERKLARYEQLEGAISRSAIEAARFEAEALKKRRSAVGASINLPEPLIAPVTGLIAAATVVVGQVVEAKEILFEVIDPTRLGVEALAYDAALVGDITEASAQLPAGSLELKFIGGGRQLREQAIPLLFSVLPPRRSARGASPLPPIAVGQPLKVIARTSRTSKGAALPQAALIKIGSGETAVWVHDGAEYFVMRKVTVQPLDATRAAATSGIRGGDRVVTEGAGLLAQVR